MSAFCVHQKVSRDSRLRRTYEAWKDRETTVNEKVARAKLAGSRSAPKKRKSDVTKDDDDKSDGNKSNDDKEDESTSSRPAAGSRKGDLCSSCKPKGDSRW